MLKTFKINKRESNGSKSRITSADISTPTQLSEKSSSKNSSNMPTRYLSQSSNSSISPIKNRFSGSNNPKDVSSPEKVIKAVRSYKAHSNNELSFNEGEFYYVIGENDKWFEASNPSTGKQGLVPKKFFEVIEKKRQSLMNRSSVDTNSSNNRPHGHDRHSHARPASIATSITGSLEEEKMGSLYAIVLYDFKAEKSDELTAYVGENLFICAHHNYEWFIAKPIGRLGGPGLVPVGFVSIIDIKTGYATGNEVIDDIKSVNLPTIQEWKTNVAKYKANNITLGEIELQQQQQQQSKPGSVSQNSNGTPSQVRTQSQYSPAKENSENTVIQASVNSYDLEGDKFWFSVVCEMSHGKIRYLKRYYQDFYDLQVQLLDNFPSESGKLRDSTGQWSKRIIPYIPGPVPYVTDSITRKRKEDLNIYVETLVKLPKYISRYPAVQKLFAILNNGYDREESNDYYKDNGDTAVITDIINQGIPNGSDSNANENGGQNDNTLTSDDLKLNSQMTKLSLSSSNSKSRPPSVAPPPIRPTKIKFYYKNDIFALMLNGNTTYSELHSKIAPRIDSENFKLHIKTNSGDAEEVKTDSQVSHIIQAKLKISVYDTE